MTAVDRTDVAVPAVPGGTLEFARRLPLTLTAAQEAYLDALDGGRPAYDTADIAAVGMRAGKRQLRAIVAAWALVVRREDVRLTGVTAVEIAQARDDVAAILRAAPADLRPPTLTLTIRDEVAAA